MGGSMIQKDTTTDDKQTFISDAKKINNSLIALSRITGFTLHLYNKNAAVITSTDISPLCRFIESFVDMDCQRACERWVNESIRSIKRDGIAIYKCPARIMSFALPLRRCGEEMMLVGRNGFATYKDLMEFLKICKNKKRVDIPIDGPISFHDEDYTTDMAGHMGEIIDCILERVEEKVEIETRLRRLTSILDNRIIERFSTNREMIYIYILDTIEFLLDNASTVIMTLRDDASGYETVYSTGRHRELLKNLQVSSDNDVVKDILTSRVSVHRVDPSSLSSERALKEMEFAYIFPVFINERIEAIICVFEQELTDEEIRIIRALRDYIQITIENQGLRLSIDKKSEEVLSLLLDTSRLIAPLLDTENLFQTILERSIQLLNAEQGSLMLIDHDTSELLIKARKGVGDILKTRLRKDECIAGRVVDTERPLLVEDVERHPLVRRTNRPHYKTKSFISVPIKVEDRVEGVINITDKIDRKRFDEHDLKMLEAFTASASIAIQRNLFYKETERLKRLSITDPLTSLYNRRYINERIKEEITRFKRYKQPFTLLMLDIDGFKAYNDEYGHIKGDHVLKTFADVLSTSLRTIDIAGRFGGDEFLVILSQTSKADAISLGERLKKEVNNRLSTFTPDPQKKKMTISMGIATFPDDAPSFEDVLEKVDEALYLAKKGGGNRISFF